MDNKRIIYTRSPQFLFSKSPLKLLQLDFKKLLQSLQLGLCPHDSTEPAPAKAFGNRHVIKPNG